MVCYFFSRKAGVNKGEQGESNAEGMGCTQLNFNSPVRFIPRIRGLYWFSRKKGRFYDFSPNQSLNCQNLCAARSHVNSMFKLTNISTIHAS